MPPKKNQHQQKRREAKAVENVKMVGEVKEVIGTAALLTACETKTEKKIELTGTAARDEQRAREQDEGNVSDQRFDEIRSEIEKQHLAMADRAYRVGEDGKAGGDGILDNKWNLDALAPAEWPLFIALKNQLRGILVSGDLAAGVE